MARYINLDALVEILDEDIKTGDERVSISWMKSWLLLQPKIIVPDSADVAPRAEVAREILAIIDQRQHLVQQREEGVREPWHNGYYSGKHLAYQDIKEIIEQKYLEGGK